jgi:hypothetical protein
MGWTFYNASGQQLSTATTLISNLDIDGATDIGADIVDADLFIIDDGAGGTNRKTAASRIKTYAGTTQAVEAALEAETNEDTYAPPDLIKHSPGVAKGWCQINETGALVGTGYNIASITDSGTGQRVLVWDVDFADANYSVLHTLGNEDNATMTERWTQIAAGSVQILIYTAAPALVDEDSGSVAFGTQ